MRTKEGVKVALSGNHAERRRYHSQGRWRIASGERSMVRGRSDCGI